MTIFHAFIVGRPNAMSYGLSNEISRLIHADIQYAKQPLFPLNGPLSSAPLITSMVLPRTLRVCMEVIFA